MNPQNQITTFDNTETQPSAEVVCTTGRAVLFPGKFGALLLTGKRTRKDALFFSRIDENNLSIQGLYRGHYGDALCTNAALVSALRAIGANEEADQIESFSHAHHP